MTPVRPVRSIRSEAEAFPDGATHEAGGADGGRRTKDDM